MHQYYSGFDTLTADEIDALVTKFRQSELARQSQFEVRAWVDDLGETMEDLAVEA